MIVLTPEEAKRSRAGLKPFDALLMFEQIEFQVRDRMSFRRFLGLTFEDEIPKTARGPGQDAV